MGLESRSKIESVLIHSGVVCMAVDTVYGLVASAKSPDAVSKLYTVKGREGKPGTIIAASSNQLVDLGFDAGDVARAEQFWPGPVSVILPAPEKLRYLHMGLDSLAVRIPAKPDLLALLEQTGPLATTSANKPGEPTVTTISNAKELFGKNVSLYVDSGTIEGAPSSIYKLNDTGFEKIR